MFVRTPSTRHGHAIPEGKNMAPKEDHRQGAGNPEKPEDETGTASQSPLTLDDLMNFTPPQPDQASQQDEVSKNSQTVTLSVDDNYSQDKEEEATKTLSSPKKVQKYKSKMAEAKACLQKAKMYLDKSRNLKTEIKTEVTEAIDRLYSLVKEALLARKTLTMKETDKEEQPTKEEEVTELCEQRKEMMKQIDEHSKLLKQNREEMSKLTETLKKHQDSYEKRDTYANVAAASPRRQHLEKTVMHSLVISSKDEQKTGEEVFDTVKQAINAKEEGARIDRFRKARDRKIIVGCRSPGEIKRIGDRIRERNTQLNVETIKNKDPLIILYSVLKSNTDEDIVKAIQTQNRHLIREISAEENRIEIRYRRKARNALTNHVVARVSPQIWRNLTGAGAVHIDMQRVRVADQSPLIQCSCCLAYGHGKRFCTEAVDVCSHCGGPHLKSECPDWLVNTPPSCINCTKIKAVNAQHGAFSNECPVRRKWEALARSTVAYC